MRSFRRLESPINQRLELDFDYAKIRVFTALFILAALSLSFTTFVNAQRSAKLTLSPTEEVTVSGPVIERARW